MLTNLFTRPNTRYAMLLQFALLCLLVFSLLRLVLLATSWGQVDHSISSLVGVFATGVLYDLGFISYVFILFSLVLLIVPNKILNSVAFKIFSQGFYFLLLYGLGFMVVAEWLFWDEFSTRFNFIAIDYLIYRHEVTQNIYQSYPLWWILLSIFLVSLFLFVATRESLLRALGVQDWIKTRFIYTGSSIVIALLFMAILDQGAREFLSNNYNKELASNGPYQFFAAFRNNALDYEKFYLQGDDRLLSETLKQTVQEDVADFDNAQMFDIKRHISPVADAKNLNVILITMESFSANFMQTFGNSKENTPNLDKLAAQSLLFTRFYATGTRTTRGLEAVTLAIPPTPGRSIVKRPDNSRMYSLGKVFNDKAYDVAYLYGGRGYFDNMNAFFTGNGYRIVDQNSMDESEIRFENAWGVSDEDLYQKTIREARQAHDRQQPFFYHVMTTSNHRPYTYPDNVIDIPSGTSREGAVKYTDYALGKFIQNASHEPWFENTLFVITSDHCARSAGKIGLPVDKYHIPMMVYSPANIAPGRVEKVSSQIDLAPTLLSLLNMDYESYFFGKDILAKDFEQRALIGNYQKLGLYKNDQLVVLSPQNKVEAIQNPTGAGEAIPIEQVPELMRETMAYYQGANYILQHKMNRW